MKSDTIRSFVSVLLLLFLIAGCTDTPNPVGNPLIPQENLPVVRIDTLYATFHKDTLDNLLNKSVDRMLLGQCRISSDGWQYSSWALLRFYAFPDSLLNATITSASLQLKSVSHFGSTPTDSLSPLSFDIYQGASNWTSDSLTYDSLQLSGQPYYDRFLGSAGPFSSGDNDSIEFPLDTAVVHRWFIFGADTILHANDGIVLKPTNSSMIKGFYSFNATDATLWPMLIVTYSIADTATGIAHTGTYVHSFGASDYAAHVDPATPIASTSLMYVQNGIAYHAKISFDSLPVPNELLIHSAILEVTRNSSASHLNSDTRDSLYASSVSAGNEAMDFAYFGLSQSLADSSGQRVYRFNVQRTSSTPGLAQLWIQGARPKKVMLSGFFESGSLDLFALYGAGNAVRSRQPRLIITYSPILHKTP